MPSFSGPSTPELWVQDGSLELQGKIAKGTLVSKVRTKEVDPLRDADLGGVVEGEDFASLPRGFVELSNCLGILVLGFEKEINSLLRKLEAKKGCGVKASGGRQHSLSSSRLEKEIRRLKCSVNYNSVPSMGVFSPCGSWVLVGRYVDVILQLIDKAGDFVSDDIWFRVVQFVTNNEDLQPYAAAKAREYLDKPAIHETMVKVSAYLLGEYSHLLARRPGCSPKEIFGIIHEKLPTVSTSTVPILLSTYAKILMHTQPSDPELQNQIWAIFSKYESCIDVEIQQRAVEYFALSRKGAALMDILAEMPKFPERQSSLLKKAEDAEVDTAEQSAIKLRAQQQTSNALVVTDQRPANGTPYVGQLGLVMVPSSANVDHNLENQGPAQENGTLSQVDPQSPSPSADLLGDLLGPLAIEGPPGAAAPTEQHVIPASEGDPNPADALALAPVDEQTNSVQMSSVLRLFGVKGFSNQTDCEKPVSVVSALASQMPCLRSLVHIPGLLIQTPKNCKMECEYLICLSFLQPIGNIAERFHALCLKDSGVLYEDPYIQIGIKAEWRAHHGRLVLFLGNKNTSSLASVQALILPPSHLKMELSLVPETIPPRAQVQCPLEVMNLRPSRDVAVLDFSYKFGTSSVNVKLRLPAVLNKFLHPISVTAEEFFPNGDHFLDRL
ncbi:AP-2 complex subunit alpha-1 [Vitis vinifera]|uniref:AP-2 complex subunit alpha-1 n=1 Tax=Vitis vinifera TaxID=29760 RepID=A0A438KGR1_VITVI|nr:AP-2 complex subunit alpha-1 [Vitis vinifera]